MTDQIHFLRQSIKGRIADMIFERMIRDDPNHIFTIIPYGYEYTVPELAQYHDFLKNNIDLASVRRSPDFLLIKSDRSEANFVEVKYRKHLSFDNILKWSTLICEYWPNTHLFLVTQDGFYFDKCNEIVENKGRMKKLDTNIVPAEMQVKYLNVLKEFISIAIQIS